MSEKVIRLSGGSFLLSITHAIEKRLQPTYSVEKLFYQVSLWHKLYAKIKPKSSSDKLL